MGLSSVYKIEIALPSQSYMYIKWQLLRTAAPLLFGSERQRQYTAKSSLEGWFSTSLYIPCQWQNWVNYSSWSSVFSPFLLMKHSFADRDLLILFNNMSYDLKNKQTKPPTTNNNKALQIDLQESSTLIKLTMKHRPKWFKELYDNILLPDWICECVVVYLAFYLVYLLREQKWSAHTLLLKLV